MKRTIILYGGGGHAKVVYECIEDDVVVGFVDDNPKARLFQVRHLGAYNLTLSDNARVIIAIGDNKTRLMVSKKIAHAFTNAIHPTALISKSVTIGVGCAVFHRTIVQASTQVGNHVILNTAAQVDHDSVIGDYAHIGPAAVLCGNVIIGEGALIGAGAIILPGLKIGNWCTIGAGSVVTKNIPDHALAFGTPANEKVR